MSALAPAAQRRTPMGCGNTRGPVAGISETVDGYRRTVDFEPGYDCIRHHGEAGGRSCHGRHGMNLRFLFGNEDGVVQLLVYASDWLPGSLTSFGSTEASRTLFGLMAADLGHHWRTPTYEGEFKHGRCEYLDGDAACFYDGSGLNAARVLDRFLMDGLDAVWEELAAYHRYCTEGAAEVVR